MEHEAVETTVARTSALIYLPIAIGAAVLFLLAASLIGEYPMVARIGGTIWIGILSLIIAMPVITSWVKKRQQDTKSV